MSNILQSFLQAKREEKPFQAFMLLHLLNILPVPIDLSHILYKFLKTFTEMQVVFLERCGTCTLIIWRGKVVGFLYGKKCERDSYEEKEILHWGK